MRHISIAVMSLACAALASPAWAQKDKDHGLYRGGPRIERGVAPALLPPANAQIVISERDRAAVQSHYRTGLAAGNCPPGLAKKHNGCIPPGQAKKMGPIHYATVPAYYPPPGLNINIPLR